jgi:hypothetical protein
MTTPVSAASGTSRPVIGSVLFDEEGSFEPAVLVVAVLELLVVAVLELLLLAFVEPAVVDGVDVGVVEAGEECECECPVPASGSMYCWSPADEPPASAAAGASSASAPRTIRHARSALDTDGPASMALQAP